MTDCLICDKPIYPDEGRVSVADGEGGTVLVHVDCVDDGD